MVALYFILAGTAILLAFVLLSFLGPEHSEKPFWQKVQKIRAVIDLVSYYIICGLSAGFLGLIALAIIKSLVENYQQNRNAVGLIVSAGFIPLIGLLVYFCIRSLRKEHDAGVRCECIGDCSKCKIQCRSNPNYYGIQRKENGNEKQ